MPERHLDIDRSLVGNYFFLRQSLFCLLVIVVISFFVAQATTRPRKVGERRDSQGRVTATLYSRSSSEIVGTTVGCVVGLGLPCLLGLRLLSTAQANRLFYRLDGTNLGIDEGVFTLTRKSIPLDRITDFRLTQSILMRAVGIWGLGVQTAGAGAPIAEAVLFGLVEPEKIRDMLVRERDMAVTGSREQ